MSMPHADLSNGAFWRDLASAPPAALALGFLGLAPFFAAAAMLVLAPAQRDAAMLALLAYGAVILSFLGGVRWGLAIAGAAGDRLFWPLLVSIAPSLIGWAAVLIGARAGLALLAAGLAVLLLADWRLASAPAWYRALRVPLSAGAIASLALGALI